MVVVTDCTAGYCSSCFSRLWLRDCIDVWFLCLGILGGLRSA
ncbi:hypothetical protein Hanom_Chr11g01042731 [Helianthus anomalus]